MKQNHLAQETSPYLLQHADNPVDWWPWCEEALTLARVQNKPILLSIGYSACHWCHVMAHESFADPATAEVMNTDYINIKVDREERPDLDKIYQSAHQLLNRRAGGWPLTAILTPDDLTPFFVGTYFPKTPRHNLPGFVDVLQHVVTFYQQHTEEIRKQNRSLVDVLTHSIQTAPATEISPLPLDQARRELGKNFDQQYAGFGGAPKFPHPTIIERLLRHWSATRASGNEDKQALNMANRTLQAMAAGGIYDQLGGGFCRYSVDERWMIPHFEKMLYDNGPLLCLYAEAWQATGNEMFKRICEETAAWVIREMQSDQGGYYSSLDADSEGEEGKYYAWDRREIKNILSDDEYIHVKALFGLNETPNFEGLWHLYLCEDIQTYAERAEQSVEKITTLLISAKHKLLAHREQRIRPGRDEKILTAWNALMIKGMVTAGLIFNQPDYLDSATRAIDFIRNRLFVDGRLLATYKDGQSRLKAYLDDHAFMIDALLHALQARWRNEDLQFAIELAELLLRHFEDKPQGGFFFTANDHEILYHRPKPMMDESIPSGNGIAAHALLRLGHLLGEHRYTEAAERTLKAAWPQLGQTPYVHASLLLALEESIYPPSLIVLRGELSGIQVWQEYCNNHYRPRLMCFAIPDMADNLPGLLHARKPGESTLAYVCSGTQCQSPINTLQAFQLAIAAM